MLQGRYDDAAGCFRDALAVVTDRTERAAIELRLGELTFKRGAVPESVDYLQGARRSRGRGVPPNRGVALLCALWEALFQTAHCLLPTRLVRRRSLAGS